MRRRLLVIAIFLLAGAVVNVAVAWGCALWVQPEPWVNPYSVIGVPGQEGAKPMPEPVSATHAKHPRPDYLDGATSGAAGFGLDFYVISEWPLEEQHRVAQTSAVFAGWPMKALWGYHTASGEVSEPPSDPKILSESKSGILITSGDRWIPFLPIWPGFLANTFFYAAILWLIIPGPFALRRLIRWRRGLCPSCGYDLRHGEHEACPECGVTA